MDRANAERCTFAGTIAFGIEPLGGILNPKRGSAIDAIRIEGEDQAHEFCFHRIDRQLLLDLGSALLSLDNAVAERSGSTVPKSLLGRLAHRAAHILAVLAGGVLIEDTNDLAHQQLARIIAGGLAH
nr:hypothetical protein [Sphingorhabdus rigui]